MSSIYLKNSDISRILIGIPQGHKHLRIIIELKNNKKLIFSEATLANIVRAYITVKTHPKITSVELLLKNLENEEIKNGYSKFQLLESYKDSFTVSKEMREIMDKAENL